MAPRTSAINASRGLRLRRAAFRICSILFATVYRRLPLLGRLRSSAALIERDGRWLVVHRSDGRGWCFPGGMAAFREPDELTVRREVEEETGMRVLGAERLFRYADDHNFPSWVTVFAATAEGDLRGSWEGEPAWLELDAMQPLFDCQRPIVDYLRQRHPQ